MKITQTPAPYASAYKNAPVRISADENELVELDIYDGAKTGIIGRRRFTGAISHDANIANYARNLLSVSPLRSARCTFANPPGRTAELTVTAGESEVSVRLAAGVRTLFGWEKLSASPDTRRIAPGESDEIPLLPDGSPLEARATLRGDGEKTLPIASQEATDALTVFCLRTDDLASRIDLTENELVRKYDTLEISVGTGQEEILTQAYRLVPARSGTVRLCWWNTYGQIDYYTMQAIAAEGFETEKERIRTAEGFRTTGSRRVRKMILVSDFEPKETMEWLAEIVSSPKVWIADGPIPVAADVLSQSVTTHGISLSRLTLEIRKCEIETFQHE